MKIRLEVCVKEKISGFGKAMRKIGGYDEVVREISERE
jgi:hypothetical protein